MGKFSSCLVSALRFVASVPGPAVIVLHIRSLGQIIIQHYKLDFVQSSQWTHRLFGHIGYGYWASLKKSAFDYF